MPYQVRDPQLLQGRAAGDLIDATLAVSDTDAWLTRIDKIGTAPLADPVPDAAPGAGVAILRIGDLAPETALVDERGDPLSLARLRGTAVALTFIYTRCPLPQYCPLLDRRFADVQRLVKDDPALKDRVQLLSVSFDPDADSPAVLRAHAAKLGADRQLWHFATAPRAAVDRFAASFGVNVIRETDTTITHNMRTVVIDPVGNLSAVHDGTEWTAEEIVADLRRALSAR
jgi:protein SCO1